MKVLTPVLLFHSSERRAVDFCLELRACLREVLSEDHLVGIPCTADLATSSEGDSKFPASIAYVRRFATSPAVYDDQLATARALKADLVPVTIFCVTRQSFTLPIFRNSFIHHTDAAGLRPDVTAIPVLIDTTYDEVLRSASSDEHLTYTLRRTFLTLHTVTDVADVVRFVLNGAVQESKRWRRERRRWLTGRILVLISGALCRAAVWGGVVGLVVSLVGLARSATYLASIAGFVAGLSAAMLLGFELSAVPPSPAFRTFRMDDTLRLRKALRYVRALRWPSAGWAVTALLYGTYPSQIAGLGLGFLLGVVEQRWRYIVFQPRLRLTGVENFAEHMLTSTLKALSSGADDLDQCLPRFRSGDEVDWPAIWDAYAMRLISSPSRTLRRPRPKVFISYVWEEADRHAAELLAETLKESEIPCFLDARELKRGLPWRSRVAIEISAATHFILLLSKRTAQGGTCSQEARQALACVPLSAWPQIIVCSLDPEAQILDSGGDPVFEYLLRRAETVRLSQLTDSRCLQQWIRDTAPESYVSDLYSNLLPLAFRRLARQRR